jgi:hypothetical protein
MVITDCLASEFICLNSGQNAFILVNYSQINQCYARNGGHIIPIHTLCTDNQYIATPSAYIASQSANVASISGTIGFVPELREGLGQVFNIIFIFMALAVFYMFYQIAKGGVIRR